MVVLEWEGAAEYQQLRMWKFFLQAPIARVESNGQSVQHSINADVRELCRQLYPLTKARVQIPR